MTRELKKRIAAAYAKLTPAQQSKADELSAAATDAATAYAKARDQLFGPLQRKMESAYRAYAKQLGLPADTFVG